MDLSTGQVARLLGVPEPRVNDLDRHGKIDPPPPVVAGPRQWGSCHVVLAAIALGVPGAQPEDPMLSGIEAAP
jgi:hypothetical protein